MSPSWTSIKTVIKKPVAAVKALVSKSGGTVAIVPEYGPGISPIGTDYMNPVYSSAKAKRISIPRPKSIKSVAKQPPTPFTTTPVDASPGAVGGPLLGTVGVTAESPTFYDNPAGGSNWGQMVDEGIGGSGSQSAGADSAGSAAETAAGTSAADDGSIPWGGYSDDIAGLTGPMAQLWDEIKGGAAELGISLEEYANRILLEYPWIVTALGVTTGAGLLALLYGLASSGGDAGTTTTTTGTKKRTKKKTAKSAKPKGWSQAEYDAWNKARGSGGPVSKKEWHSKVWPDLRKKKKKAAHHHHHHDDHHHHHHHRGKGTKKGKGKKKGKRVTFTTKDGEKVSFYAKS